MAEVERIDPNPAYEPGNGEPEFLYTTRSERSGRPDPAYTNTPNQNISADSQDIQGGKRRKKQSKKRRKNKRRHTRR